MTNLITGLTVLLLVTPLAAQAQESIPRTRVAFVGAESASTNQHFLDAFRQGLREHGYIDGQNLTLEERWAEGQSERFPALIGELVRLKARVILTVSLPAALAAKRAATTIPIVFIAGDPLGSGLVDSLARPGGNLTGLSISLGEDFSGKWLELLRETVPKISRVGVLWNPTNPANAAYVTVLQGVAQKLGVRRCGQRCWSSSKRSRPRYLVWVCSGTRPFHLRCGDSKPCRNQPGCLGSACSR